MAHHATEIHFEQSIREVHTQLGRSLVFTKHPEYRIALFVASHPEEIHQFRVVWKDDRGQLQMHRGFYVNYSSTVGSLSGPIRFERTVNLDIIRFLGWEQLLKAASLKNVSAGAFAAGADFDPHGRSSSEIISFCNVFMAQVSRNPSVAADSLFGEIGVSQQILEHCQSCLRANQSPTISKTNPFTHAEASAVSLVSFAETVLNASRQALSTQVFAISGSGKLAIATAIRILKLGGRVATLSDRYGTLLFPTGLAFDQLTAIKAAKESQSSLASVARALAANSGVVYYPGEKPWRHVPGMTIAMPCAEENEIDLPDAEALIAGGVMFVVGGSTMSCTQSAVKAFERSRLQGPFGVRYIPSRIATAAGHELHIEECHLQANDEGWQEGPLAQRLIEITRSNLDEVVEMVNIYTETPKAQVVDLDLGSCILAVTRLAQLMKEHGLYWS